MNLNTIATVLAQSCHFDAEITGICTDSRYIEPGNLFIAITGERFDGHHFVREVAEKGAVAVVVKHVTPEVTIPQFVVADPVMALAQIAAQHRQNMRCPIIALTGSNGKTTVKEMIAAILPSPSHATRGNLNNHIGVPLSVLALTTEHRYAVFELGANHPGEIAHTVAIVHPAVALINNIAPAHVEGFGSIEGVAKAKGEIYEGLAAGATAVVNDDDTYAHFWDASLVDKKVIRYSLTQPRDVYAKGVSLDEHGCGRFMLALPNDAVEIQLRVPGLHNVRNALAAAACCFAVGIGIEDIQRGLVGFHGVKGRMTVLPGKNRATIIDDTYNANLRSVLAGLEVLAARPGKTLFIFGDMGELGDWATEHHREVGATAKKLGINQLLSCGALSRFASEAFGMGAHHFSSQDELIDYVSLQLNPETTVLVKGSRSSAMEKVVDRLLPH